MIHNPVLHKELLMRFRLRYSRSALVGFGLLAALLIGVFYYNCIRAILSDRDPKVAATIFIVSIAIQYLIVCVLAPSLTANAITQEREQQTWEMLIFTRLAPIEILMGKLLARLVSGLGLLAIFLPLTAFSWAETRGNHLGQLPAATPDFHFTFGQFCMAYFVMVVSMVFYATFSLYLSLRVKRTIYAMIGAYVFVIGVLFLGTGMLTFLLNDMMGAGSGDFISGSPLLWVNPARLMVAVFSPNEAYSAVTLFGGLLCYLTGTVFLLSYMVVAFRRFSEE